MTDCLVFLSTCSDTAEADRIATALVEERLAACVNVIPGISSIYRWQGKVDRAQEILLLIKTVSNRAGALRARISELHSYDTPEIIALPITDGAEKYLTWLRDQVAGYE